MRKLVTSLVLCGVVGIVLSCATSPFESAVESPFQIKHGQTVSVSRTGISVEFSGDVYDSRCPANAYCIWPGYASIRLELKKDSENVIIELATDIYGGATPPAFVDVLGYRFRLTSLMPYPGSTGPIKLEDYVATIEVTELPGENPISQVILTDIQFWVIEQFPYVLDSAGITGDTISLWINYSGGCTQHFFQLYMSPSVFAESFPVQASLYLRHFGQEDPCEAIVSQRIQFDLSPIAERFRELYQPGGQVTITFRNCSIDIFGCPACCQDWSGLYNVQWPPD